MKRSALLLILSFFLYLSGNYAQNFSHATWDQLLKNYVNAKGKVNYKGFKNDVRFNKYLIKLQENKPGSNWTSNEKLAFWINAYNAFTIKLILDNYPVKSIRDIEKAWDKVFIKIGDSHYSLNDIEHHIIRKYFNEPRIHFALVCAAHSCPLLRNEAYTASKLINQLNKQAMQFINDPERNTISKEKVRISQIFNWFEEDFTRKGTLIQYLNKYSEVEINENAKVEYLEYDWSLNAL